ncbi:MAG: Ig-like domain-containing protein [Thermoplasmata archaeon]
MKWTESQSRLICLVLTALFFVWTLLPLASDVASAAYQGWLTSDSVDTDTLTNLDQTDWWDFSEVSGRYVAVFMVPSTDYDLRIYSATGGGGGGGAVISTSSTAGTTPELCVCNCNSNSGRSAEVYNSGGGGWNSVFRIEYQVSSSITVNSVYSNAMSTSDMVEVYTVSVQAGVPYTFRFTSVTSATADFRFYVFNLNAGNWGTRASAIGGGSYTSGVSTPWSITPPAATTYGIVIVNWNLASATYNFVAGAPDLVVTSISISPSPVTCSSISVIPQNRLYTYTVTVYNQGYADAGPFTVTMYFDWVAVANWNLPSLAWRTSISSDSYIYNTANPDTHVLAVQADSQGTISEDGSGAEYNNWNSRTDAVAEVRSAFTNDADDTLPSPLGYSYYFYAYYMTNEERQKFALWGAPVGTDFDMYLFSPTGTQLASAQSASYPETLTHTATTNGYHYIQIVRAAGGGKSFTFSIDDAAPTIQVVQPGDGAYIKGNYELRLNCQDYGSGITDTASNPVYRVDGGAWQDLSYTAQVGYNYVATLATSGLLDGGHTIEYMLWDNANNYAYVKQSLTSDNTAPSVCSLVYPTSGQHIEGTVTFKVSASDQIGLGGVDISFGGNLAGLGTQHASMSGSGVYWEYQLDTTSYPDGVASVQPTAKDRAGNTLSQSATAFTIDNNPPSLSVSSPSNGDYVAGAAVPIVAAASDAAGTVTVHYRVDGGAWRSMSLAGGSFTASWDTTGFEDGEHTLTVRATDGIGHTVEQKLTVVVDNHDPTCSLISPSPGQYIEGRFDFKVYAKDANGISSVKMTIAGVGTYVMTYNSIEDIYERELDTTLLSDALYSLSVQVVDNAAARGLRPPVTLSLPNPGFYIDNVPPTLSLISPQDRALIEGTVSLGVTSFDAPTPPIVEYSIDGISWVSMVLAGGNSWTAHWDSTRVLDGEHRILFRARGQLGHQANLNITVVVDNNSPVCAVSAPIEGQHIEGSYVIKVSAWDAVGIADIALALSNATTGFSQNLSPQYNPLTGYYETVVETRTLWDGVFSINATVWDYHGHRMVSSSVEFSIDNNAPWLRIQAPGPESFVSGDVELRIQVIDAFLAFMAWSVDEGPPTLMQTVSTLWDTRSVLDGRHTLTFYAVDMIGHLSSASVSVVVDNHGPSLFWGAPDELAFISGTYLVKVKALDDVGIASVTLYVGAGEYPMTYNTGSGYYEYPLETAGLDGTWDLRVVVRELSGQNADNVSIRRVHIDNNPPMLHVHSPSQGSVVSGLVELNYTVQDVHLLKVEYRLDNLGWFDATETWNTTLHPDGIHTLVLRASDMMGHTTEVSFGVTIDNSMPSCIFIAPPNNTFVSGVVVLKVHALDEAGLSSVSLGGVGALPLTLNPTSGLYEAVINTLALEDGECYFTASAVDLSGRETVAHLKLKVDNHPPCLSVLSPEEGAHLSGELEVRAEGKDVFEVSLEYQVDSLGWRPLNRTLDTAALPDGAHSLLVRATDLSGWSTVVSLILHTDNTLPAVSILEPVFGGIAVSGDMTLRVAVDEDGGVSRVTYAVDDWPPMPMVMNRATGYYEVPIPTRALQESVEHKVTVNVTSRSGLTTSQTRAFMVDNSPPEVVVRSPDKSDQKGEVSIVVDVSDATGVSSVLIRIDGGQWREMVVSRAPGRYIYKYPTTVAQNGEHTFEVRVEDTLGNRGTTVHTFRVKNEDYSVVIALALVIILIVGAALVIFRGKKKTMEVEPLPAEPEPETVERSSEAFPEMPQVTPPEPQEKPLVHVVLEDKRAESEAPAQETGPREELYPIEEITGKLKEEKETKS